MDYKPDYASDAPLVLFTLYPFVEGLLLLDNDSNQEQRQRLFMNSIVDNHSSFIHHLGKYFPKLQYFE